MKSISREKAALGVFAFLVLAGLGVLITYIVTVGHSLNVAASSIDDATGSLDDYTAVLYKGTVTERRETVVDSSAVGEALSPHAMNKRSTQDKTEDSSGKQARPIRPMPILVKKRCVRCPSSSSNALI